MADMEMLQAIGQLLDVKLQPVQKRLDGIDERLNRVDERLDGIDERLNQVDERLDGIDEHLERVDEQLINVDKQLTYVKTHVKMLELLMENEIKPRLNTIEECYLSTYRHYMEYGEQMKKSFADIDILKKTVHRHSLRLQSFT